MGRKPNQVETVKFSISATPAMVEMLDWLATRGPYGKNRAEVAERFVAERLQQFLPDEKFTPKGNPP